MDLSNYGFWTTPAILDTPRLVRNMHAWWNLVSVTIHTRTILLKPGQRVYVSNINKPTISSTTQGLLARSFTPLSPRKEMGTRLNRSLYLPVIFMSTPLNLLAVSSANKPFTNLLSNHMFYYPTPSNLSCQYAGEFSAVNILICMRHNLHYQYTPYETRRGLWYFGLVAGALLTSVVMTCILFTTTVYAAPELSTEFARTLSDVFVSRGWDPKTIQTTLTREQLTNLQTTYHRDHSHSALNAKLNELLPPKPKGWLEWIRGITEYATVWGARVFSSKPPTQASTATSAAPKGANNRDGQEPVQAETADSTSAPHSKKDAPPTADSIRSSITFRDWLTGDAKPKNARADYLDGVAALKELAHNAKLSQEGAHFSEGGKVGDYTSQQSSTEEQGPVIEECKKPPVKPWFGWFATIRNQYLKAKGTLMRADLKAKRTAHDASQRECGKQLHKTQAKLAKLNELLRQAHEQRAKHVTEQTKSIDRLSSPIRQYLISQGLDENQVKSATTSELIGMVGEHIAHHQEAPASVEQQAPSATAAASQPVSQTPSK